MDQHHLSPLIGVLVIGIGLAFLLGTLVQRLKLPPLVGYLLATHFPIVGQHIEALIVAIVVLSLLPAGIAWLKQRRGAR